MQPTLRCDKEIHFCLSAASCLIIIKMFFLNFSIKKIKVLFHKYNLMLFLFFLHFLLLQMVRSLFHIILHLLQIAGFPFLLRKETGGQFTSSRRPSLILFVLELLRFCQPGFLNGTFIVYFCKRFQQPSSEIWYLKKIRSFLWEWFVKLFLSLQS